MTRRLSATTIIAIVTVAVSVLAMAGNLQAWVEAAGFIPARIGGGLQLDGALPWWITPFSSSLLHGGPMHLIVNMVMLLLVGSQVERIIGASGQVFAYIAGALVAALAQYLADPASLTPMVGASGAISALFGLYGLFFGKPPQLFGNQKLNRAVHVAWLLVAWVAINWATAFMAGASGILLATPAHVGGFIAGLLLQRPLLLWRYRDA